MAQGETIQQQRTSEWRPWEPVDILRGNHEIGYGDVPQFSEVAKFDQDEESIT
jgi:hypothetical protein